MFVQKPNPTEVFEATCHKVLADYGIRLTTGRDFAVFKTLVAKARPNHTMQKIFDCDASTFEREDAFWMAGYDLAGELVYVQAMRLMPTGAGTVAQFISQNLNDLFPAADNGGETTPTRYRPGPNALKITGRLVYSGELWIGGSCAKLRGSGLSSLLARNSFLMAMQKFSADYVFGFMISSMAQRGTFYRAGFHNAEPHAMRWSKKGEGQVIELDFLHMSRDDMMHAIQLPIDEAPLAKIAA